MKRTTDKPPDRNSFDRRIQDPELRKRLINLARRQVVPPWDCEDVASDVIEEAIRCQAEYDPADLFHRGLKRSAKTYFNAFSQTEHSQTKPEGRIISLDAALGPDGNTWEPKDAREPERSSCEQVEHFVDTASLSEKEQKAITSRLDKDDKHSAAKFNPSTDRRALQKLKQIASDDKFRRRPEAEEFLFGD